MKISKNDRLQVKQVIDKFNREKTPKEVFYDLCFCICAPQTTFKSNLIVNKSLKDFKYYEQRIPKNNTARYFNWYGEMCAIVRPARFYHNKTKWLIEMKRNFQKIYRYIRDYYTISLMDYKLNGVDLREWLVDNIKGLGMKAASHFLRNQGYTNLAVIDVHILRFLNDCGYLVDMNISKEVYLHLEELFIYEAKKRNLTPAELDAIIWKQRSKTEWKDFIY